MKTLISISLLIFVVGSFGTTRTAISQEQGIAGTFFGDTVSIENYKIILRTVLTFQTPWGSIPNNLEQAEKRVWDDLILSYEAHRRQITVEQREVEEKITETLKGDEVLFNWKESPDEYEQWVQDMLNQPIELFENQMRHLVQVKKLHQQVRDSINPIITEEEAFAEFLNERNSLSVEVAEFDKLEEAEQFYKQVKIDSNVWEETAKKDKESISEDRKFRRPGFVALEFLIEMWKFPKGDVYDMIEMEIGEVYPPAPIYKGYGVFKVLDIRRADESNFSERKDSYFNQLRSRAKYKGFKDWLANLRKDADIQIYIDPPHELFP